MLAVQADGADDRARSRASRRGRRAHAAAAVVPRAPRAAVRLLHAGDADERDRAARAEPAARPRTRCKVALQGNICRCTGYWNIVEAVGRRRRGRCGMTAVETAARPARSEHGLRRAERPAQGGPAARPGPGRLRRRRQAARHGLRPLRPLAVRARADRLDRRARRARAARACYGTLTGDEVAILTDPFFQIAAPPGGNIKDYALAVGKVRYLGEPVAAVVARDARARPRRRRARRGRVRAAAASSSTPRAALDRRRARAPRGGRRQPVLDAASSSGATSTRRSPRPTTSSRSSELHFDRFNSTPLECDGALVEYNRGTGAVDDPLRTTSSRASPRS